MTPQPSLPMNRSSTMTSVDAQPDRLSCRDGGIHSALVLRLGAGHGQVGAELGAEALRLFVIDFLVQPGQDSGRHSG